MQKIGRSFLSVLTVVKEKIGCSFLGVLTVVKEKNLNMWIWIPTSYCKQGICLEDRMTSHIGLYFETRPALMLHFPVLKILLGTEPGNGQKYLGKDFPPHDLSWSRFALVISDFVYLDIYTSHFFLQQDLGVAYNVMLPFSISSSLHLRLAPSQEMAEDKQEETQRTSTVIYK